MYIHINTNIHVCLNICSGIYLDRLCAPPGLARLTMNHLTMKVPRQLGDKAAHPPLQLLGIRRPRIQHLPA